MYALFADLQVQQRDHEDDGEQDQRRGARPPLVVGRQRIVDEADHRVEPAGRIRRPHRLAEDADDAGVFLEAVDKAGDDDVGDHRREQRHGDAREDAPARGAVHARRVIILPVHALQPAQQDQDLERQRVPHDVDDHDGDVGRIAGAVVDPVDRLAAEKLDDVVDDACGDDDLVLRAVKAAHDVEHGGEHHADGDGVGHVGQEEDGLQRALQPLDGVEEHRDEQRQQRGDQHRRHAKHDRIAQAVQKALVLHDAHEVVHAEGEHLAPPPRAGRCSPPKTPCAPC